MVSTYNFSISKSKKCDIIYLPLGREVITLDTRTKIVNSSIKNFLNLGYEKTSLDLIASEVGIKKPSIYYHFKNKEELFTFSIEYILKMLIDRIPSFNYSEYSSKHMLENTLGSLLDFNIDLSMNIGNEYNKPVNLINLLHLGKIRFPNLTEKIDNYYNILQNNIENIILIGQRNGEIKSELNPKQLSTEIIAWYEGLFTLSSVYSSFNINNIRQSINNNIWINIASVELEKQHKSKNKFFKSKSHAKSISLGTKW